MAGGPSQQNVLDFDTPADAWDREAAGSFCSVEDPKKENQPFLKGFDCFQAPIYENIPVHYLITVNRNLPSYETEYATIWPPLLRAPRHPERELVAGPPGARQVVGGIRGGVGCLPRLLAPEDRDVLGRVPVGLPRGQPDGAADKPGLRDEKREPYRSHDFTENEATGRATCCYIMNNEL